MGMIKTLRMQLDLTSPNQRRLLDLAFRFAAEPPNAVPDLHTGQKRIKRLSGRGREPQNYVSSVSLWRLPACRTQRIRHSVRRMNRMLSILYPTLIPPCREDNLTCIGEQNWFASQCPPSYERITVFTFSDRTSSLASSILALRVYSCNRGQL